MDKKLIFLDIDGTLTSMGRSVPPDSALQAIREARARGHKLFLCTGRNYGMMKALLGYGFDGAIASAGGYVLCGGQVLYDMPMSDGDRDRTTAVLERAGFAWTLETRDFAYSTPGARDLMLHSRDRGSEAQRWKAAASAKSDLTFCDIEQYNGAPVYKIMFIAPADADLALVERELGDSFFVCLQSGFHRADIIHGELINRAFDKGTGVKCICAHLNVPLADTVGFGDSMNDLAMLETVGTGVCMEDGDEELKKAVSLVSPPVGEDGIYKTFLQLGLIEG